MKTLPLGWQVLRLGDVLRVRYGKALPAALRTDIGTIPVVGSAGPMASTAEQLIAEPAVVVGRKGNVGAVHLCESGSWPTDTTYYMTPGDRLDVRFLAHQLCSLELSQYNSSTAVPSLRRSDLEEQRLIVPPLAEQRRIVEVLEYGLSRLCAAERIVSSAELRLRAWQKSSLDHVIRADMTSIGRLRDLVDRIEAGKSFGGSAPPARDGQWGVVKVSAMTWGRFRAEENKAVTGSRVDPRFEIRPGDVLVSRANTSEYVGAPVLVEATPPRLLLSDKSLRLVPRQGVNPRWLVQVLAAPTTRRQISLRATGTKDSMRNISQSALLEVMVPVATPEQQDRVIALADAVGSGVVNSRSAFSSAQARSSRLRRALLEAALTGRLTGHAIYGGIVQELADV